MEKSRNFKRSTNADGSAEKTVERRLTMQRGVSQLLFSYLPGRVVGWENGLAIVQLDTVRLASAWSMEKAQPILDELALWLDRWKGLASGEQGRGEIDEWFPDPRQETGRFVVGEPTDITAKFFDTALHCTKCSRLVFRKPSELGRDGFLCPHCKKYTLRQFSQVLVHGCGELIAVKEFIPGMRKNVDGTFEAYQHPLRCIQCGKNDELAMPARSERVRDIYIKCLRCNIAVLNRITARCPRCIKRIQKEKKDIRPMERQRESSGQDTVVTRVAMRMTGYSASEAYYPHGFSMLRLDNPVLAVLVDPDLILLRKFLPVDQQPIASSGMGDSLTELARQIKAAEQSSDLERLGRLQKRILQILQGKDDVPETQAGHDDFSHLLQDRYTIRSIEESVAFKTTVKLRQWYDILKESGGANDILKDRLEKDLRRLGLHEMALVEDLPVISATFGYTRRSSDPIYQELSSSSLPTTLRPFPPLDRFAARALGKAELTGTVPILAREGKHEGVFLSLDPDRVVEWTERNNISMPLKREEAIKRILAALEPVDRYHDHIWKCDTRRFIFGLVHSISHALMRVTSHFSGLERTSMSEYLLLPLLGTVVFDNSSTFMLGGIEMMMRDHLIGVLEELQEDAMNCVFDVSCIDRNGACPGCIHSPEISCRVFNHGLSRAFLIGGHAPWADVASEQRIVGYWEIS